MLSVTQYSGLSTHICSGANSCTSQLQQKNSEENSALGDDQN